MSNIKAKPNVQVNYFLEMLKQKMLLAYASANLAPSCRRAVLAGGQLHNEDYL